MQYRYRVLLVDIIWGAVIAIILTALVWLSAHGAVITTYGKRYSDSARVHPNRRYHPDSMNVASGWRELYGATLILIRREERITLWHGREKLCLVRDADTVRVKVKDVMNKRYDEEG